MGTSRKSTNIEKVYISILKQLKELYVDLDLSELEQLQNRQQNKFSELKGIFMKKLESILEKDEALGKIVIVFDALDQLAKEEHDINQWIINELLTDKIRIVYTVLKGSQPYNNMMILMNKKENESNYSEIISLKLDKAVGIMESWLKDKNRQLTKEQEKLLKDVLVEAECSEDKPNNVGIYPLHLRILYNIVIKWPSYYMPSTHDPKELGEFDKCISTEKTINYLYKKWEILYGSRLFRTCIFYLTVFKNGITEFELVDILSIDNDVLKSVFEKDEPRTIRFPIALWVRLRYELNNFITEKEADEERVITW